MKRPRILLADDHAAMLEDIRAILAPHYEMVGTVADGRALVEAALRLKPDLIIADITMPHLSGIEAARQIKTSLPGIKLLFVTMHSSSAYVRAALEAGASGYVLKSAVREELLDAVQSVLSDRTCISSTLLTKHLARFQDPTRAVAAILRLSMREPAESTKLRGGASTEQDQPIQFANSALGAQRHICAFFHSSDEEYRVILPFIKDGFECGHKALHVVDPNLRHEHRQRLASAGVDVDRAEQSGQFELRNWDDVYLRDGRFDQDRILAQLQELLDGGRHQGFVLTRIIAHMEWALEDRGCVNELLEYEARVNYMWPRCRDAAICVYDLAKFGRHIVMDILRTHPMVLIGGIIQENPFFQPPDESLRELRERRSSRID
jgi:DNA-binding NarL/FixJ family response regulator